jgi:hypothetical protein
MRSESVKLQNYLATGEEQKLKYHFSGSNERNYFGISYIEGGAEAFKSSFLPLLFLAKKFP